MEKHCLIFAHLHDVDDGYSTFSKGPFDTKGGHLKGASGRL